jgi:acetyl/propionyl-CoA carboxylase alpha subunit
MTEQLELTEDQLAIQKMAQWLAAVKSAPFAVEWKENRHLSREANEVQLGRPLLTVEAMKMEDILQAAKQAVESRVDATER